MTTKRKSSPIALRVNGKAVIHAAGAKLAAAAIGCTQTTGSQVGQGNVRGNIDLLGAGRVAQFRVDSDNLDCIRQIADKIDALAGSGRVGTSFWVSDDRALADTLTAAAAALRNAARLREANHEI